MRQKSFFTALVFAFLTFSPLAFAFPGIVVAQDVPMRAGPDSKYTVFATVFKNQVFEIHGCLENWTWCDVQTQSGNRGWIESNGVLIQNRGPVTVYGGVDRLPMVTFNKVVYWNDHYRTMPFYEWNKNNKSGYYDGYGHRRGSDNGHSSYYYHPRPMPPVTAPRNAQPAPTSKLGRAAEAKKTEIRSNLQDKLHNR